MLFCDLLNLSHAQSVFLRPASLTFLGHSLEKQTRVLPQTCCSVIYILTISQGIVGTQNCEKHKTLLYDSQGPILLYNFRIQRSRFLRV